MQEPSMDTNRLYELLRKLQRDGLKPEETNELSNEIFNMAGNNVIAQFNAKMDAVQAQLSGMRWLLGVGLTILGIMVAYGTFFK